jgi:hypothetical protein
MIITTFLLYHTGLLIGKLCLIFTCGSIFYGIGAAMLYITSVSVDIIHNFCILIKKNIAAFLFLFYLILCIDIVYLILCQVQKVLVNDHGYHI